LTREVRCWGSNASGQLGNGSNVNSSFPVAVSGLTNATAISTGDDHSCALLSTREVRCWGSNAYGQLGNESYIDSNVPVAVSALTDATAISVGASHSCALLSTREVRCWGRNFNGQLGDDSNVDSIFPVAVSGLTDGTAISVGASHSCALLLTREARCWGRNADGQLGNGSLNNSRVPISVSHISSVGGTTTTTTTTTTSTTVVVERAVAVMSAPVSVSYRAENQSVTLQWSAVTGASSYVVTTTSGTQVCTATTGSCVVNRLRNGRSYDYNVFAVNADGVRSTTGTQVSARPGFQIRTTTVKTKRSVSLSSIVTTPSKGRKTWTVTSGGCRISGTRLVAPTKKGSCKLRLSTTRSGAYGAMSTTITVTVR
jgi:hypothetical protein